jgi:hypothetical protein
MPAFEEITAADFDDTIVQDDLRLPDKWYNTAGELDINAIDTLRKKAAKASSAVTGDPVLDGTETGPLKELTRVLKFLSSANNRVRIVLLKEPHVVIILDAIQTVRWRLDHSYLISDSIQWLDLSHPEHSLRRQLLYLLIKLAAASHLLPTNMFLQGVNLGDTSVPWRMGGFADIFRGWYQGREVVGKRLRLTTSETHDIHTVSSVFESLAILPQIRHRHFVGKHSYGIS